MPCKERGDRVVAVYTIGEFEDVVSLIREHKIVGVFALRAQTLHQGVRLALDHARVVLALDHQQGAGRVKNWISGMENQAKSGRSCPCGPPWI